MLEPRAVAGFEGAYTVDAAGRVFTIERRSAHKDGKFRQVPPLERKPVAARNGYLQVRLSVDGVKATRHVHRLVAEAFVDGRFDGAEVNHKNGDRHDNRAENLEWVSRSANNTHKYRVLKSAHPMTGVRGAACKYSMPVQGVDPVTGAVVQEFSAMKEAQRAGFQAGAISRCISAETRTHRGLRWRLANRSTIASEAGAATSS